MQSSKYMNIETEISLTKKNKAYLLLAGIIIFTGLILANTYRPYIYEHNINDFKFADTIGSLIAVVGFCYAVWGFKEFPNSRMNLHIILATLAYSIIWEPLGLIGIHGTFDWYDMIAAGISGLLAFLGKEIIERKYQTKNE